jgi:uncharacterized protein YjdB
VITYQAHVSDIGWQGPVQNGTAAGTTGQSRAIEAIKISIGNNAFTVKYRVYIQDTGWGDWASNGQQAGTTGQSRRTEAIEIALTNAPSGLGVVYQAYCQNIGWQEMQTGCMAGTTGQSLRLEAVKIVLAYT